MLLMDMKNLTSKIDDVTFIKELIGNFPEIKEELLDDDLEGIITLQIGCFKRFTQKAIDNKDLNTLRKCFQFVDSNISQVNPEIENALVISYLGKLNIPKNSQVDYLLSKRLRNIIIELNDYYSSRIKNHSLKDFLSGL